MSKYLNRVDHFQPMDFYLVGLTLQKALNIASDKSKDESQPVTNIYIEPSDSHVLTDENGVGIFDNLSSRQLSAGAEIRLCNRRNEILDH